MYSHKKIPCNKVLLKAACTEYSCLFCNAKMQEIVESAKYFEIFLFIWN